MHTLVTIVAQYFIAIPVVAWLVVLLRLKRPQQVRFIIFSIASLVLTFILAKIATSLHQDPRPFIRDHVQPYFSSSTDNGFPSDHTTYSALLALIVLRYNRWLGVGLFIIAALIGTARVIAGVHHGQDIVAGLIIACIGVGLVWLADKIFSRRRATTSKETEE